MCLDADTGKVVVGVQVQHLPERRADAPRRLGVARCRSRDGKHLRAQRGSDRRRAQQGRQAALGAIDRRGMGRVHDAWRTHHVADHRRRPRDRECRRLELGDAWRIGRCGSSRSTSAPAKSSTSPRRADDPTIPPTRRRSSRPSTAAAAHRGQRRRRRPRDQAADRREGLELRRGEARHQHGCRGEGDHRDRVARRREPRLLRPGDDWGDRRQPDGRHQADEVGGQGDCSSASPRLSSMAIASTRSRTGRRCGRSTSRPEKSCGDRTSGRFRRRRRCLADGKIYVGTESGKFFILRPGPTAPRC